MEEICRRDCLRADNPEAAAREARCPAQHGGIIAPTGWHCRETQNPRLTVHIRGST